MKRLANLTLLSTGLVLALVACRGGGGDDTPGDDTPMPDAPPGGSVKIKDVQNDTMPDGTAIELRGVVVTAVDNFGDRTGDFFVQDAEGGPFSGIKVFGAPLDQVASLQIGDIVDITNAEKEEFKYMMGTSMDEGSVTEVKGAGGGMMTVTKKGTGTVPAPLEVDVKAIHSMTKELRVAEWEKYEGVLIKVVGARQSSAQGSFGAAPDQTEFRITGVARVQSSLTDLNTDNAFGVCYASITGIGDHFFNDLVLPRSASDLVTGGTTCNPFATTIAQAQTGTNVELAQLTDVYVMGISFSKKAYWVSTSLTATAGEGLYVFASGTSAPEIPATTIGKKITVQGAVDEFNDDTMGGALTEIINPSPMTVSADPAGVPVPITGKTAAELMMPANAATHESVLVTLTNVAVDTLGNTANGFIATGHQGATTVKMSTEAIRFVAGDVGCYTTITGFWTNLQAGASGATTKPNSFGFIPLTLGAKAASGTACN